MMTWRMVERTEMVLSWMSPQLLQLFTGDFLYLALVFFVLALLAAIVGLRGVAGISMEIARIFVFIFLILLIVSLIL